MKKFQAYTSMMLPVIASVVGLMFAPLAAEPSTTIVVPLDAEPSWRDMAYLAAAPAAEKANGQHGSLLALDPSVGLGPEFKDYLDRFRPGRLVLLKSGSAKGPLADQLATAGAAVEGFEAASAAEASLQLSKRFWKSSESAVLCSGDDYDSALVAAGVAGILQAPLIFSDGNTISAAVAAELKRLGTPRLISVGAAPQKAGRPVTQLSDARHAMRWLKSQGKSVSYVAAVNPLDRDHFTTRKLSLIGAQLAVGRRGLVAPLKYQVEWKRPFPSALLKGTLPAGIAPSGSVVKIGTINVGDKRSPFILTGEPQESNLRLFIDTLDNGTYAPGLRSGDTVKLGGRIWAVSLGTRTRFGDTDVHLTWPTATQLRSDLSDAYQALGGIPEHLCLVGFPDALPHAIFGKGGVVEEQASDLPYSQADDSGFAQIAVGRLIAENVSFGSLHAARALTYSQLRADAWQKTAGQAEWENTLGPLFENVGFVRPHHFVEDELPWKVPPTDGKGGTRESSFGVDSPLARSAVIAHSQHSSWQGLGRMLSWDSQTLLAPAVLETGGCGTTCLDRERDNRSVVARALRLGAVCFAGGSRELSTESQPMRMEFWNGVLAGQTMGQAHRRAQNAGLVIVRDHKEDESGAYRYSTHVRMLFGDPAVAIAVPAPPRTAPARTVLSGDRLTVYAPEKWSVVKAMVPPDWKSWAGKDLFVVRGPGAVSKSSWSGDGRDKEIPIVLAEFRTRQRVSSISQVQKTAEPLGWNGQWYSAPNPDGTFTHRFTVRLIDFDQLNGKINQSLDHLEYQVVFE